MLQSSKSSVISSTSSSSRAFFNHSSTSMCEDLLDLLSFSTIQLQVIDCFSHSSKRPGFESRRRPSMPLFASEPGSVVGTNSHPSKSLARLSACLATAGLESQISLLHSPENFDGKVKLPGKESREVVITEL